MLMNKGKLGRERILARPTVEFMLMDHLTPAQKAASAFFPGFWDSQGWGLGVSVQTCRANIAMVPGQYGWGGHFGTQWRSDPAEDMIALMMTQRSGFGPVGMDFMALVYQAIDD
jgi:CubicO group peptidase (beta-lactamase class C family)